MEKHEYETKYRTVKKEGIHTTPLTSRGIGSPRSYFDDRVLGGTLDSVENLLMPKA